MVTAPELTAKSPESKDAIPFVVVVASACADDVVPVTRPYESVVIAVIREPPGLPEVSERDTVARSILSALITMRSELAVATSNVVPDSTIPPPATYEAAPLN